MPNTFLAREHKFTSTLAEDIHLSVTWDGYDDDDDDQNLVTWRFPGALDEPLPDPGEVRKANSNAEGEWEDVEDEDEEQCGRG